MEIYKLCFLLLLNFCWLSREEVLSLPLPLCPSVCVVCVCLGDIKDQVHFMPLLCAKPSPLKFGVLVRFWENLNRFLTY